MTPESSSALATFAGALSEASPHTTSDATVAFWETQALRLDWEDVPAGEAQAVAHHPPPRPGRRRRRHRPGHHLVRRRQAQRRLQLRRPPCSGGTRGQGGPALRGRARRPPHHHLRRTAARGFPGRQRPAGPRHQQGRPRGHLPPGHPGNRGHHPGRGPHRRHPLARFRRLLRRSAAGSGWRTRARSCWSPPTGSSAAAWPCRSRTTRTPPSPGTTPSSTSWWSTAPPHRNAWTPSR